MEGRRGTSGERSVIITIKIIVVLTAQVISRMFIIIDNFKCYFVIRHDTARYVIHVVDEDNEI